MANICNFCLKISNACRLVDEILKETIELIFINIEFLIAESSVICGECFQRMRSAFDLKSTSICNEDLIVSYETNKPRPEKLIGVYLEKNKVKCDIIPNDLKICRICITAVSDNNFCILEDKDVAANVREIISTHLPEVDFTVTNQPIVCKKCLRKLQDYGRFINGWLDIYNLKKSYCAAHNKTEISDLNDVRNFIFGINIDAQHSDIRDRDSNNVKKGILTIQEFESGEQWKYPVKEFQIKSDSVSCDFQLGNDVLSGNDDLDTEKLQKGSEIIDFEPKMESNDELLENVEVSIHYDDFKVFEEYSGHLDTQKERNEENSECGVNNVEIKDDINVHELKYPFEGLQIKLDSVSADVQVRNDVLYGNDHFESGKSKQKIDLLHIGPNMERVKNSMENNVSKVLGEYPQGHLDTQLLCLDNREEEENEEHREDMVDIVEVKDEINIHELKYPVEGLHIKPDSVSCGVQLRNDVSYRNAHFQREKSKNKTDILHLEPKIGSGDKLLEKEEIFIDDSNASEDDYEENSDSQLLCINNQGIEQQKSNECSPSSKREVPMEESKRGTVVPRNGHFEREKSKRESDIMHLKPKMESDDYLLKEEEIFIDDTNAFEEDTEENSNSQLLCIYNQGIKQQKFNECSSSSKRKLPVKPSMRGTVYPRKGHFEREKSKQKSDIFHFKPKMESVDYLLKEEEIFTDDSNALEEDSEENSDSELLCIDNQGIKQQMFNGYSSSSNRQVPVKPSIIGTVYPSFNTEYLNKKKRPSLQYQHYLRRHGMVHSKEPKISKCEHCDYKSSYKYNLKLHSKVHSNESKIYNCEHCDYISKCKKNFNRHLIVHSIEAKIYKCEHCDYKTKYKRNLKLHSKVHSNESKIYKCEHCDFNTNYKSSLKLHLMVHSNEPKIYKCEHCDYKTNYSSCFKSHLIVHSNESKMYKCEHCHYKTKYKNNLKMHLMVHSNAHTIYSCEHCDFNTKYKYSLKSHHLKLHSNVLSSESKLYKCEHCEYKTEYKTYFNKHLIVHSSEPKMYKCEHCDFKTKYKHNLKFHSKVHSNETKIYKCEHCNYITRYKKNLNRHLIVHPSESIIYK